MARDSTNHLADHQIMLGENGARDIRAEPARRECCDENVRLATNSEGR